MKTSIVIAISNLIIAFYALIALAETKPNTGSYRIDPAHSKVGFEVAHLVISSIEGKFASFDGAFTVDPDFHKSSVDVTVYVDSISTEVKKRDDHLRSPDFFDAAKFPVMKFQSTQITGSPNDFVLKGNLTIRNVTKEVALKGTFLGQVKDQVGNDKAVFHASTKISRARFGLTWNQTAEAGPVVGNIIKIDLKIEAIKDQATSGK